MNGFVKDAGGRTYTRKVSPKLGLLGALGLLGFAGFLPSAPLHMAVGSPTIFFFFFGFFGFFGFYYEGKMSGTMIDERFERNAYRASALANKAALLLIFAAFFLSMTLLRLGIIDNMLGILIAALGFALGLAVFLSQYLRYRYENEM